MLMYCKKCGRQVQEVPGFEDGGQHCDYCHSIVYPVPDEFLDEYKIFIEDGLEEQFIEEYIKSSPEFDQYLYDHRDEWIEKSMAEDLAMLAHGKAVLEGRDKGNRFGVTCPYCHATNVKKISGFSKLGTLSWGATPKEWHCTHCGSDF